MTAWATLTVDVKMDLAIGASGCRKNRENPLLGAGGTIPRYWIILLLSVLRCESTRLPALRSWYVRNRRSPSLSHFHCRVSVVSKWFEIPQPLPSSGKKSCQLALTDSPKIGFNAILSMIDSYFGFCLDGLCWLCTGETHKFFIEFSLDIVN